jgi:hypothetical protein
VGRMRSAIDQLLQCRHATFTHGMRAGLDLWRSYCRAALDRVLIPR